MPVTTETKPIPKALITGLSMIGGAGLIMMILALGIGVLIQDDSLAQPLALVFVGGVLLLVTAVGAWIGVAQPQKHFDNINEPLDDGHGHGHDAHDDQETDEASH